MFLRNKFFLLFIILISNYLNAQGVIEYDKEYPVDFFIYNSSNSIVKMASTKSKTIISTPEELVQAYFFATDSISLKSLFFDAADYSPKKQKHFDATKKMNYDTNYVTLLHKFSYEHNGNQMCYINYIFKYENIDFTMPTNLSCIKNGNKWYIYKLGNQININEILWTFKSCKILQLIDGENLNDTKTNNLINLTRSTNKSLDINKLYLQSKKFDTADLELFTMKKDNSCSYNGVEFLKAKKITSSFLWKSINVEKFDAEDNSKNRSLINSLKIKPTDSICLDSRLIVNFDNKTYSILKYKDCITGKSFLKTNSSELLPIAIEELYFVFKNLKTKFISDLANQDLQNDNKNFKQIFDKTRGQFNALNTTKLYYLFKENKTLFNEFLDE